MTLGNFITICKNYLTKKSCKVKGYSSYLCGNGIMKECEFIYKGNCYRLTHDRYNRWTIYKHKPYPVEMKHYERVLQGNEVWSKPYKDIAESLDKFFEEN